MPTSTIVIVGRVRAAPGCWSASPRARPSCTPDGLDVHLVDPYPPGAGRIWRHAQSPLLAMNSMAADVTMYTDESVVCEGPIAPGPSFWDWAQTASRGRAGAGRRAGRRHPHHVPQPPAAERLLGLGAAGRAHAAARGHAGAPAPHRATGLTEDGATQIVHLERQAAAARRRRRARLRAPRRHPYRGRARPRRPRRRARACATCRRSRPPTPTSRCSRPARRCWSAGSAWRSSTSSCCSTRAAAAGSSPTVTGCATCRPATEPYLVAGSPRGAPYHAKTALPAARRASAAAALLRARAGRRRCSRRASRSTWRRRCGR